MGPNYKIIQDPGKVDLSELQAFVTDQSTGNFFQSRYFWEFYKSLEGYEPILICVYDENSRMVGSVICVINRLLFGSKLDFLTRGIVMGGPVIGDNLKDKVIVMDILIRELIGIVSRKSVYLEFPACHRRRTGTTLFT